MLVELGSKLSLICVHGAEDIRLVRIFFMLPYVVRSRSYVYFVHKDVVVVVVVHG
jgi:hypothetical protein